MSSAFEGLPKTPNLKLNKPGYDNVADIEALNENADILDEEIQGIKNTFVKSVNGKEPDAGGNVNVEEYTHPNSGVTAGTYRSVTVNAQGHVTGGSNPTLAISEGGTGATTPEQARENLELGNMALEDNAIIDASISGKTITLKFADNSTKTLTTQDTNTSNWTLSKATNGYARDASTGFTIEWFYVTNNYSSYRQTYTFHKAFNSIYSVHLMPYFLNGAASYKFVVRLSNVSATSVTWSTYDTGHIQAVYGIAFGYTSS